MKKTGPTLQNLVIDTDSKRGVTAFTAYAPPGQKDKAYELLRLALPAVKLLDDALKAADRTGACE